MALHASWVHGNVARAEWVGDTLHKVRGDRWDQSSGDVNWSDIVGLPRGWGVTFRGKRSEAIGFGGSRTTGPFHPETPFEYTLKGYWFHFPIPTPVFSAGRPATLQTVFVLWEGTTGVSPAAVHIWEGPSRIETIGFASGPGRSGAGGRSDLIDGITRFRLPTPHPPRWGISLSVGVSFEQDGDITFNAAGADFDI
jgi:hypothetical protein